MIRYPSATKPIAFIGLAAGKKQARLAEKTTRHTKPAVNIRLLAEKGAKDIDHGDNIRPDDALLLAKLVTSADNNTITNANIQGDKPDPNPAMAWLIMTFDSHGIRVTAHWPEGLSSANDKEHLPIGNEADILCSSEQRLAFDADHHHHAY